ncbi:Hypothetical protein ACI5QN_04509 [Bacillus cereus]
MSMMIMLTLMSLIKNSLWMYMVVAVVMYLLLMTMLTLVVVMAMLTLVVVMAMLTLVVMVSMMIMLTLMMMVSMMAMMAMLTVKTLWITTYSACHNTYSRYRKSCLYSSNERWKCSWYTYWTPVCTPATDVRLR